MDFDDIESDMIKTCDKAVELGWKIVSSVTYDPRSNKCCALGAHIVANSTPCYSYWQIANAQYGMFPLDADAFIAGFDGKNAGSANQGYYSLGQKLRRRYIK